MESEEMKGIVAGALFLVVMGLGGAALADTLYGRCIGAGGDKCQKHHRISTSWNGRTATIDPVRGTYKLDFGGRVDHRITVYCDGDEVGKVRVDGRTEFTVDCR